MPKSTELIAQETREIRLKMWGLVKAGKSESAALREVMPDDTNRQRKLKNWKARGLLPPPEETQATPNVTQETNGGIVEPLRQSVRRPPDPVTHEKPAVTQFDPDTAKVLQELADTYRKGMLDFGTVARPVFKRSETIARSIRLDKELLRAAEKEAKRDRLRTNGSLNGLIEWLLWEYLGKDPRFIE